jgi:CheY-like chemotaxis protein
LRPLLVADDSPVALLLLARRLRAEGLTLREATSATEASGIDPTELAGALLDLDLGDGTGVEVAETLRASVPELPIAFFSAGAPDETLARARAIGRVFRKPDEIEGAVAWSKDLLSRA